MKKIQNAKTLPQVYYGLHMVEGVAEYPEHDNQRILIGEVTIKNMDPTFSGKPVYVRHVNEVDLENLQAEADGYVVESFFNPADGKHWAKFIVVSDKGHEAIRNGWKLSNAYVPTEQSGGGLWHGVEYSQEVMRAEYEHLAIVPNPRYGESVILTPDQFKEYNHKKESELKRLANSQEQGETEMLFFKKTKVENSADYEGLSVTLPKSKIEKTIGQIVNEMDDYELKMKEPQMANPEHHVMINDVKMPVKDLVAKHLDCMNELEALKKSKAEENDMGEGDDMGSDDSMDNAEPKEEPKKENEDEAKEEPKEAKKNHFDALKNAHLNPPVKVESNFEMSHTQVARGKARYGSK